MTFWVAITMTFAYIHNHVLKELSAIAEEQLFSFNQEDFYSLKQLFHGTSKIFILSEYSLCTATITLCNLVY